MKKFIFLGLLISLLGFAQKTAIVDSSMIAEFPFIYETNDIINSFNYDASLKNATWGFSLYDPETGKEILNKDSYTNYIPASTTKLISSESALRLLGEDFTWKTQISYTGTITDGVLDGNLYVLWNGDPTINLSPINAKTYTQIFADAIQNMKNLGIKKVNGSIKYESVVFDSEKYLYPYDERMIHFGNYYSLIPTQNEELSADEIEFNNTIGAEETHEEDSNLELEELSIEDQIMQEVIASIELNNKLNKLQAIGKKNLSLAAPPAYGTKLFYNYLSKNGISVAKSYTQQDYLDLETFAERKTILLYKSPPLKDLVYFTNQRSSNPNAENMMRAVGIFIGKRDSKWSSAQTVTNRLEDIGFYYNDMNYVDGSGLSYDHKISPITQVKYLATIMHEPFYETFYHSLPAAGQTGTLRNMFKTSPHLGTLHAKTGTLGQIPTKTLAGYITLKNGKTLCFSLLINRYSGSVASVKLRMEKLLNSIY